MWLWYCHGASFTSEQELLVRSSWLFAFWHLYLDLSLQFPNWTLDVLHGPCEEWSAPHTCWQLASQAETSRTFLPNTASTCADPLLYLLPPAFLTSFCPNFHASVIYYFFFLLLVYPFSPCYPSHSSLHFHQGLGCLWSFARTPNPRRQDFQIVPPAHVRGNHFCLFLPSVFCHSQSLQQAQSNSWAPACLWQFPL